MRIATAAGFSPVLSRGSSRTNAAQRAAIFWRVGSSNGQIIPLDYNTSAIDEMTPRRPGRALAREPGPITTDVDVEEKLGPHHLPQHASVVMGPRFRGDDGI